MNERDRLFTANAETNEYEIMVGRVYWEMES